MPHEMSLVISLLYNDDKNQCKNNGITTKHQHFVIQNREIWRKFVHDVRKRSTLLLNINLNQFKEMSDYTPGDKINKGNIS